MEILVNKWCFTSVYIVRRKQKDILPKHGINMKNTYKLCEEYLQKIASQARLSPDSSSKFSKALHDTENYWSIYDAIHNTDMYKLFHLLYLHSESARKTKTKCSIDYAISLSTLSRYRKLFVKCFILLCCKEEPNFPSMLPIANINALLGKP